MNRSYGYFAVFCVGALISACQTTYSPIPSIYANIKFPSMEEVGPKSEKLTLDGYISAPAGNGPFPAVVLLHACGGMRNHVVREWPEFLNKLGYLTLSVDSWSPRGARRCTDLDTGTGRERALVRRKAGTMDAYGALAFLSRRPDVDGNRVAVIGFSAGANALNYYLLTNAIAPPENLRFRAVISFYGRCGRLNHYSKDDIPAMQIVGERDNMAPLCREVGSVTPMEVHILPGAEHGFDTGDGRGTRFDPHGTKMEFNRPARDAARELTKAFLAKQLEK